MDLSKLFEQYSRQESQKISLSGRVQKSIQVFDQLAEGFLTKSKLELVEKKEKNLEQIKRILLREAYFLDEEKKWIKDRNVQNEKLHIVPSL